MTIDTEEMHELPPDMLVDPPISPIFEQPASQAQTPPPTQPPSTHTP